MGLLDIVNLGFGTIELVTGIVIGVLFVGGGGYAAFYGWTTFAASQSALRWGLVAVGAVCVLVGLHTFVSSLIGFARAVLGYKMDETLASRLR
jgi:hypothetical protein